ncbi:hypothetical protein J3R83DRAFT_11106 [Lanmaoa asiatica]|nr:hypothetical protein J3R83DRAFT_11106 [Lanmaoa asiatica]
MATSSSDPTLGRDSLFQSSVYIGMNIQNILYGIELYLYFKTVRVLLTNRGARNLFYALFSSMMLFSVTVWVVTQAIFNQKMWLLESDFPGGPDAYWKANASNWYVDWGTIVIFMLQLMTDALMIYRCLIIWDSYRVVVIPIILWLTTLALAIIIGRTVYEPGGDIFTGFASRLGLAYYTVSVFLNTTLTCIICYRIVRFGNKIRKHLGHEPASLYFTVATIIVESALPYTLSGIAFLVSFGTGSPTSVAFICVYFLMMCISPQMLILRVIRRIAWDRDASRRQGSTIRFDHGSTLELQQFHSSGTGTHVETLSNVNLPDERGNV